LPIDGNTLNPGINKVNVLAQSSFCAALAASRQDSIRVLDVYSIIKVSSTPSCQSGSVRIEVEGAPMDGYYNWYEQESDLSAMANQSSSVLMTPVLTKSRTYFVAA